MYIPIDHPYRTALMDEVHARPVDLIPERCRIRRLVLVLPAGAGAMVDAFGRFTAFCAASGLNIPGDMARQHSFSVGHRAVTWEFHTEFITITWRSHLEDKENWPPDVGLQVLEHGQIIGAVRVDVIGDAAIPERLVPGFKLPSLCVSDIEGGSAQVATDFVPDDDRYVRYELAAGSLTQLRRSIIVRRLLEVETYRTMALLGLPLARELSPVVRDIEVELSALMEQLPEAETPTAFQEALIRLHALSISSGRTSERLSYRFAAGRAYGVILRARLNGLRERSTVRGSTLTHYVSNRVDPALATCAALETRLEVLSTKMERAIGLLEVRIGIDLQKQNASLLDNIAQTTRSQLLLQRTVEGLSAIAISYYLLGILSYGFAGLAEGLHWQKALGLSIATPVVVISVWLAVKALKGKHFT